MSDEYQAVHTLLHRLWTKAVGTPGYEKAEWKKLECTLDRLWVLATGEKAPLMKDGKL